MKVLINNRQLLIKVVSFILLIFALPSVSMAVPSFARQTGLQCAICHDPFPQLTAFGRQFKINGYTMSTNQGNYLPLAAMLMPSFTHTQKDQAGGAAPDFNDNNNFAVTQASIFYAGRLFGSYAENLFGKDGAVFANKFGIFMQNTYDGVDHQWHWDNWSLRYADEIFEGEKEINYGFYVNNNPSVQDPWNTIPAWGFPFSGSGLANTPSASPLISGGLAQQVIGAGAYAMFANGFYADLGGYKNLAARTQSRFGVDPTGETEIAGTAPYWRFAHESNLDGSSLEIGTFGLSADTYPGRDSSAGHDHTTDIGFDSQFQSTFGVDEITARTSFIREKNNWNASQTLGNTANAHDDVNAFNISFTDWRDKTYGPTIQYFVTTGDKDMTLYGDSAKGSPDSRGWIFEANWMPFNKQGGLSSLPTARVKFSLQYVLYNQFDGGTHNYDGAGHDAKDNNTLYLEAWTAF